PDGPRLNVQHVLRELNINEVTLWRWQKRCPPLGGKPLKPRWDKSPNTGKRQKTFARADIDQIKRNKSAPKRERRETPEGVAQLTFKAAMRELGITDLHALTNWEAKGCVHLDGAPVTIIREPGPAGGMVRWCLQSEIDRIKESRLTGDDGRFGEPDDPYLGPRAVEEKY